MFATPGGYLWQALSSMSTNKMILDNILSASGMKMETWKALDTAAKVKFLPQKCQLSPLMGALLPLAAQVYIIREARLNGKDEVYKKLLEELPHIIEDISGVALAVDPNYSIKCIIEKITIDRGVKEGTILAALRELKNVNTTVGSSIVVRDYFRMGCNYKKRENKNKSDGYGYERNGGKNNNDYYEDPLFKRCKAKNFCFRYQSGSCKYSAKKCHWEHEKIDK